MRANLMFRDKDFELNAEPCFGHAALKTDLEFEKILTTMARGDETVYSTCSSALFCPLHSADEIRYRQENLQDALSNANVVRRLYEITTKTFSRTRSLRNWLDWPVLSSVFSNANELLKLFTEMLMELRLVADANIHRFNSEGFVGLLSMIQRELDDDYFAEVRTNLDDLNDKDGMLISAKLGDCLQGVGYVLRRKSRDGFRRRWRFLPSFTVTPDDNVGLEEFARRNDYAINSSANALAQAAEHLDGFFGTLRGELAFYVGCLNLAEDIQKLGMTFCIPSILITGGHERSFSGLFDVSLAIAKNSTVIGNELTANNKCLYIITGANQGGKTTFLRSLGQAQLMSQCGMPVGAVSFDTHICRGIFSHFIKEEDAAMKSGKLDEELFRMNEIVDHLESESLVLFNESFAATNEREGSEIALQITKALVENKVEVFSVTHLSAYAAAFLGSGETQYLRTERSENTKPTYRIIPGEPLQTSFDADLFKYIVGGYNEPFKTFGPN